MPGRWLMIGGGVLLAIFAGALWYFQFYAFYYDLSQEPLIVDGTKYPVEVWTGTDASSSPLKRRVCLKVSTETAQALIAAKPSEEGAVPLVAPDWFECFDARTIERDIQSGMASAFSTGASGFDGVDDYLAVYPDGRAYVWRQLQPGY